MDGLLFLAHRIPFPPNKGDKIRSWNELRYLAARHRVHLGCLADQAEDNFTVIDPYNAFYGYGNTKITTQFASEDPATRGLVLLVIHGVGAEAWRAEKPKAKFVIINLPFKEIAVKKLAVRKKTVMAIYAQETGGDRMTSATFWDGKKYRYQPIGSSLGD